MYNCKTLVLKLGVLINLEMLVLARWEEIDTSCISIVYINCRTIHLPKVCHRTLFSCLSITALKHYIKTVVLWGEKNNKRKIK